MGILDLIASGGGYFDSPAANPKPTTDLITQIIQRRQKQSVDAAIKEGRVEDAYRAAPDYTLKYMTGLSKLGQLQEGGQRRQAVNQLLTQGDYQQALLQGDPKRVNSIIQGLGNLSEQDRDRQLYLNQQQHRLLKFVMDGSEDARPSRYLSGMREAKRLKLPTEGFPELYDEGFVKEQLAYSAEFNQAVKTPSVREVYDPTSPTNTRIVTTEESIGRPGKPQSGMELEVGPDGAVRLSTGGARLGKSTQSTIEKTLFNTNNAMSRLTAIESAFNPDYLRWSTQVGNKLLGWRNKAGDSLTPEQNKQLTNYTVFQTRTIENLNELLHSMSGAAISVQEAKRLSGQVPTMNDSPIQFRAKTQDIMGRQRRAIIRYQYAQKQGMDWKGIPLYKIDQLIEKRGKEVEKQLTSQGMNKDEAKALAAQTVRQEFGF